MTPGLRPFQAVTVERMRRSASLYLADDMGLGKTVQALAVVNDCLALQRVLIVCPACVVLCWRDAWHTWSTRAMEFRVLRGRSAAPPGPGPGAYVVNYECLSSALHAHPWDMVIVDEAHRLGNPKTRQTKVTLSLPTARWMFLSGTPLRNRPRELWPVLHTLDPEYWGTREEFVRRYCDAQPLVVPVPHNQWARTWWAVDRVLTADRRLYTRERGGLWVSAHGMPARPGEVSQGTARQAWRTVLDDSGASNLRELQERLYATCMLRRTKREVAPELPPRTLQVVPLDLALPARLRRALDMLEPQPGEDFLAQVAALTVPGSPSFEFLALARRELGELKLGIAVDWIRERHGATEKLLVYAHHHTVLEALYAAMEPGTAVLYTGDTPSDERRDAVARFQEDPACRVFIASTRAAGVGLTLTAAHDVVFVEPDWVPADIMQAVDRVHRIGQDQPVTVSFLVLDNSLDSRVMSAVVAKLKVTEEVTK